MPERGYEVGAFPRRNKGQALPRLRNSRAAQPLSEAQQDERDEARAQEGECPICDLPLDGVISLRGGEWVHVECGTDEQFGKIDGDDWTGDSAA